jgi:hypothetical protein
MPKLGLLHEKLYIYWDQQCLSFVTSGQVSMVCGRESQSNQQEAKGFTGDNLLNYKKDWL